MKTLIRKSELESDFEHYLRFERGFSDNSIAAYEDDLRKVHTFLREHHREHPPDIADFAVADVRTFLAWLNAKHYSARTQARCISCLKHFFRFFSLSRALPAHPVLDLLSAPKLVQSLPHSLGVEQVERLIEATRMFAYPQRNSAMVEVLYGCGLRVSELCQLCLSHIEWAEGFVRVRGKGNKDRLVPIGASAQASMQTYIHGERAAGKVIPHHRDIVFLNRNGRPISRQMVFLLVQKSAAHAGIPHTVSPHTLRHCFATHLLEGGASIRAIQQMLGHESITTTEIYAHATADFLRSTLEKYHPQFPKKRGHACA